MSPFDLVIFDCDGVLVDSEQITNSVFAAMLSEIGLPVTLEYISNTFVGQPMTACVEIIQESLGKPIPDNFVTEFRQRNKKSLSENLKPIKGIHDVLSQIKTSYCVASNSTHEMIQTKLGVTELLPYFEGKIFSVTDVARGKPHPDLFLYAAEKMKVHPQRCVVVEDTPIGVQAGFSAGMKVFGYAEYSNPQKLQAAGASVVFSSMRLLPNLLEQFDTPLT
ncbi:MAG: HAD-IA family hydrolase [Brasilonema octagenarum HA4186-MV1]|jgi:HAD superfamily hydrolase (TIGR01509 family)|uniref:HAD family hydrolase n=1 Tax=Brasilonema octagenarum UFV-OR1 TaxID=417115 RepID=A0ABX1M9T8_9CYAN|nr:HAD family phosphatase [Brasilonema octagenarum]MBW4624778.1 HAD-IA family hydrolase [Brasilonema octagenarum HA4186-MV1]NMF62727.1 HAD family hydrolase [Brasilonema octagenarum UFV-OR1]